MPEEENELTLVVLAAGMGKRYGGAKQIDQFGPNGETLLDYSLYDAWKAGFTKAVFVIRENLRKFFDDHMTYTLSGKMDYSLVCQKLDDLPASFTVNQDRQKPWGTGHALWTARNHIKSPFAVINADDFYGRQSYEQLASFLKTNNNNTGQIADTALVGFQLANTLSPHGAVSRGLCITDNNNMLQGIEEHTNIEQKDNGTISGNDENKVTKTLTPDTVVSMNMWAFPADFPNFLEQEFEKFMKANHSSTEKEFYLPSAVNNLLNNGRCRVKVVQTPDEWMGITYAADKEYVADKIRRMVDAGKYPQLTSA